MLRGRLSCISGKFSCVLFDICHETDKYKYKIMVIRVSWVSTQLAHPYSRAIDSTIYIILTLKGWSTTGFRITKKRVEEREFYKKRKSFRLNVLTGSSMASQGPTTGKVESSTIHHGISIQTYSRQFIPLKQYESSPVRYSDIKYWLSI